MNYELRMKNYELRITSSNYELRIMNYELYVFERVNKKSTDYRSVLFFRYCRVSSLIYRFAYL